MRMILLCGVLTGVAYYLLLSLLGHWHVMTVPHEASALSAGLCAGLIFWYVPRLLRRRP